MITCGGLLATVIREFARCPITQRNTTACPDPGIGGALALVPGAKSRVGRMDSRVISLAVRVGARAENAHCHDSATPTGHTAEMAEPTRTC
jgi:hypothetical protein